MSVNAVSVIVRSSEGKLDTYAFSDMSLVRASIEITYSKMRDRISVVDNVQGLNVYVDGASGADWSIRASYIPESAIMGQATHF